MKILIFIPLLLGAQATSHNHLQTLQTTQSHEIGQQDIFQQLRADKNQQCQIISATEEDPQYVDCSYKCFNSEIVKANNYQCTIATTNCKLADAFDRFNFFTLLYCQLGGNILLFTPISFFIILLIFRFISATVEEYIASGITFITEYFELSEAMAAVTLIALANGAGDVITAIVASGSDGGVSYNIGALYGAGFFVCATVICLTILSSPIPIVVDKSTIYRDCGFYILSTLVTIWFATLGQIYWWCALIFLLIYVLLVIVVFIQDKIQQREEAELTKQPEKQENTSPRRFQVVCKEPSIQEPDGVQNAQDKWGFPPFIDQNQLYSQQFSNENYNNVFSNYSSSNTKQKKINRTNEKKLSEGARKFRQTMKMLAAQNKMKCTGKDKKNLLQEDEGEEEKSFHHMGLFDKFMFIIEFPLDWARKVTMPPCEAENYDKILCIIWPFPGIFFTLWALQMVNNHNVYIGMGIALAISYFFYTTQRELKEKELPSPRYFFYISLIGTLYGLLWTYVASSMLIDLLGLYVIVFRLDTTFMGLTVLGIGNALPDALTTIALAKKGYAQMGITGSYAGQLFGLLIGFGVAQLKTTLLMGPQQFSLFTDPMANLLDIFVVAFSLINLIVTAIYGVTHGFRFEPGLAYIIGGIYIVFLILAMGYQVQVLLYSA